MDIFRESTSQPTGRVALAKSRDLGVLTRRPPARWTLRNWLEHRRRSAGQVAGMRFAGRIFGAAVATAELRGQVVRVDWSKLAPWQAEKLREFLRTNVLPLVELSRHFPGLDVTDYGVLSRRLVTNAGVGYIVDAFQNIVELEEMKYHGFGTGNTAENQADSDLDTELTTEYATDNVRPTGTTTEGASANIYRTVATLSPNAGGTIAVVEHGIFSDPDVGQGVLLDRSVFAAINLVAGSDSLQATYELTVSAGG